MGTAQEPASQGTPRNVLLLVLDDVGPDLIGCCSGDPSDAEETIVKTPRLDAFAKSGVRFDNVWSTPACSPTRATILTGRYGFRTGIGAVVSKPGSPSGLAASEVCIPEALREVAPGYRTAFIGKWHLGVKELGLDAPRKQGFEVFRGTRGNLTKKGPRDGYFAYEEIHGGKASMRETYATSATIDDTLAAIESFGEDPWFIMASFHAAHKPLHVPPSDLHSQILSGEPRKSAPAHVAAVVEALDSEFGRLLDGLPDAIAANTTIIVVSDNGTPSWARTDAEAAGSGKGSLSEGGISVPMFVGGAGVARPGRVVSHAVNTTDLFATVVELCGGKPGGGATSSSATPEGLAADGEGTPEEPIIRDSISIVPYLEGTKAEAQREWVLSERFQRSTTPDRRGATNRVALKIGSYKRIEDCLTGTVRLYDLAADPDERRNLLREGADPSEAALEILARMDAILEVELERKFP